MKVGKFPAIGNGKAIALGEVEGFVKTVFDAKTGELLGAHMIGAEVTELIQGYTVGKTAELVDEDFIQTVFPHPTLSRDDARERARRLRARDAHLSRSATAWSPAAPLALLIASVGPLFWPGVPMYDTVSQYEQVLGGDVDDWHPPIMVRLWQLLHGARGRARRRCSCCRSRSTPPGSR